MTASIFLDLSAYAGIAATGLLTINYLFGMLIGISYQRIPFYTRLPEGFKRISIYNWHNITAYIALSFVLLHPALLLFDSATKFSFVDLIFPVNAPTQKLYVAFGTISMFAIVIVILTTQKAVKKRLTFRTWKNIHLISYVTGLLFIVHGIVMDPQLKNRPVDLLDAEKIASELCFLVLLAATFFRVRYEIRRRRSSTFYKLRIAEVINETTDAKTFVLDISRNRKKLFGYIPGQFIELNISIKGKEYKRAYSLSSNPITKEKLSFTVKRINGGLISTYIHDEFKAGDQIYVLPPTGSFFKETDGKTNSHLIFFAAGSGITPIYAIIQSLLSQDPKACLSLIYANRDKESIIFYDNLERLEASFPERFTITHILSEASNAWNGIKGRLDSDKIKELMTKWRSLPIIPTEYYICGPSPFMDLVAGELLAHQIPSGKIHIEKFISIGNAEDPVVIGDATQDLIVEKGVLKTRLDDVESFTDCCKNQTLLDALLDAGINAPYSCKEGICSTCKATLVSGRVKVLKHTSLTENDIRDKQILTCQAIPLSVNISIDFDSSQG